MPPVKSLLCFCLLLFICMPVAADTIDEAALQEKVLSLSEMVELHSKAIAVNSENIQALDKRVRAIESKPVAFTPPPKVSLPALTAFQVPEKLDDSQVTESLQQRIDSLKGLRDEMDEYQEYENYSSPQPQPQPQIVSNGSAGTSFAPIVTTVQYGSVAPVASSLGSGGTSYVSSPVASYGVSSAQRPVFTQGPIRERAKGFLGRFRVFGGPGLVASSPRRSVSYENVNTQFATSNRRPVFCVDATGNPVSCN